jgi:hypothetical protein
LISEGDLQLRRTVSQLREYVLALKDSVPGDPAEFRRALLKTGLYKEFLDELVPLSRFALLAYPSDYSIQLVLGNQPYDAIVFDAAGGEVDRVEVTVPQDGEAAAQDGRLVVDRGFSSISIGSPGDDFAALLPYVLRTCRAKSRKDYSGCTVVVAIEPMPPFEGFARAHEVLVRQLADEIRAINFRAKRVYLLVMPDRLVEIHG